METVPISSLSFDRFSPILGPRGAARLQATVGDAHALLGARSRGRLGPAARPDTPNYTRNRSSTSGVATRQVSRLPNRRYLFCATRS